jgi:hypothetical protein
MGRLTKHLPCFVRASTEGGGARGGWDGDGGWCGCGLSLISSLCAFFPFDSSEADTTIYFFVDPAKWIWWMSFSFEELHTTYTTSHDIRHTPYTAMAAEALDVERLNALFVPSADLKRWRRTNDRRGAHKHDSGLFLFFPVPFRFSSFPVYILFFLVLSLEFPLNLCV